MVPKVAPSSSTDLAEEEPASYGPRRPVALHGNPFGSRVPPEQLGPTWALHTSSVGFDPIYLPTRRL